MNVAFTLLAIALLVPSCVAGSGADNACPAGWRHFAPTSKCFKIIHKVTFDKAISECTRINGSLASIHGKDENDFIRAYGTLVDADRILIGLVKSTTNRWEWHDGSATNFINWAPTEPNDNNPYGKQETCVEMHTTCMWGCHFNGRWNDVACDWPHYSAVCERGDLINRDDNLHRDDAFHVD
ncbi:Protein F52E1.2 [Aphelenchoides avenae]|nr:Protein F52E1.2 [Aphelenchus avenae]